MTLGVVSISTALYSLKPIRLNSGLVESQTSYLSRLAENHSISVGMLLGKVVAPFLEKEYLNKGSRFYDHAIELNAFGNQAAAFAKALSILTGIDSIPKLTLISLKDTLSPWNVLAETKRWCPLCLEEWKRSNSIVYEPLLWSFKSVNICANHNVFLNPICPNCAKTVPYLTRTSRIGFCSNCRCWLGSNEYKAVLNLDPAQLLWEQYKIKSIGNLIINKELIGEHSFYNICLLLKALIQRSGGVSAFSRKLSIPKSTISSWINGGHKPSLDVLLKICFAFEIDIAELFKADQYTDFLYAKCVINRSIDKSNIDNKAARKIDWALIEQKLNAIIEDQELGAPSVREVARLVGCNERLLYNHFPERCSQIADNYKQLIQSIKSRRLEEDRNTIITATIALYNNGVYPTERNVERLISPLTLRRKNNYSAWKDALRMIITR